MTSTSTDKQGKQQQSSELIHTNQKHPFLTEEQGFVPAGEIVAGMHIVRADGSVGLVSRWQVVPGTQVMYNLTVAQDHTFTVGNGQWVVHNTCVPPGLDTTKTSIVIGESMTRVQEAAKFLRGKGFMVKTYKPRSSLPTFAANVEWLNRRIRRQGAQVVDIGLDKLRKIRSPYYDVESKTLKKWGITPFNMPGF